MEDTVFLEIFLHFDSYLLQDHTSHGLQRATWSSIEEEVDALLCPAARFEGFFAGNPFCNRS